MRITASLSPICHQLSFLDYHILSHKTERGRRKLKRNSWLKRMTTLEETDAAPAAPDSTHLQAATAGKGAAEAAVSADGELDPELTTDFHVDPAYTTTSKQAEEEEQAEASRKDRIQSLKSVVIISGVVVAVIGALIAVAKKIKEA